MTLWLAALPLMGSPGPATLSLAGVGSAFGVRRGARYLVGIVTGTAGVLLLIATGVTALILATPGLVGVLTTIAGLYIVYLAWRIATAPVGGLAAETAKAPAFVPGFLLAIANPKAYAAIGAVYSSQTLIEDHLGADTIAKLAAFAVVIVAVNTAWLVFGAGFSRALSNPTIGRAANIVFALLLLVSVALAVMSA